VREKGELYREEPLSRKSQKKEGFMKKMKYVKPLIVGSASVHPC
jgi:hypothetical protein